MSKTKIPTKTQILLWGKSAGRCQYRGCNESLYRDGLTKAEFNEAYIAHIYADEPGGPRYDAVKSPLLKKDLSNLMLMCDRHHRLIDKQQVAEHPADVLIEMKLEHETRMERITACGWDMQSHIVVFNAKVVDYRPVLTYESTRHYLLPEHYPAESSVVDLGGSITTIPESDVRYWITEPENLQNLYNRRLHQRLEEGDVKHISLFAFGPIPMLIKLGTLLPDKIDVELFQLHRNPKGWQWQDDSTRVEYITDIPAKKNDSIALNISLSGTISEDRIRTVVGEDCDIATLTLEKPFNDFLQSKEHLQDFSVAVRKIFNDLKTLYGDATELLVFPAIPVSAAVEFGRVWQPKADMSMIVFDQNSAVGGFTEALTIRNG